MNRVLIAVASGMWLAFGACGSDPNGGGTGGTGGTAGLTGSSGAAGGAAGALADTTTQLYAADDPNIQYVGRVTFTNPKQPRFDLGATSISARFNGTAVAVSLKDEFRYGKYVNAYDAVVDGAVVAKVVPQMGVDKYVIANALPDGEHLVTLVRRTEAAAGAAWFVGFSFAGQILSPPPRPTRRIEFIGDSITAGAGAEAANNAPACSGPPDGWGLLVENGYRAYGPVVARQLNAEWHVVGVSGIGLMRNYSNMYDARTMPQVYDLYYPELMDSAGKMDQPRWDATQRMAWTPDAVVIGLGTNDFGAGDMTDTTQPYPHPELTAAAFSAEYVKFVATLRGYYPNAHIFVVSSPVLANPSLEAGLKMTEDHFAAAGDNKVHHFLFTRVSGLGCGTHPNADQHAALAQALAPAIKDALAW
ncbi:MAG: SGNH/GDSL hydrolase family protein [Haliangium ochraceum]